MARKNPWFRLYTETVKDRKIRRLDPAHRWLWIVVLTAASESPIPGFLVLSDRESYDAHDLADLAALPVKAVEAGLKALEKVGVIQMDAALGAWWVPKWSERQFASDNSTERSQRSRQRRRNGDATLQERPEAAPCNGPDTETETEAETPSSTHALTTGGSNLLEDDISELRVRRIGRHITEDPDETVLREVRLMLHEIPEADDVTIALAVAR